MPCGTATFYFFTLVRCILIAVWTKRSMVWSYSYCCVRVLQQTCLPLVLADSSRAFCRLIWVWGLGVEKHWSSNCNNSMFDNVHFCVLLAALPFFHLLITLFECEDLPDFKCSKHVIKCCFRGCICITVKSHWVNFFNYESGCSLYDPQTFCCCVL